ncbi:MAG: molecular chaperone DnaJ [Candidatus Paceibacterota bacterium]
MNNKDYYKTLGVPKNASKEEIKKAFHTLAKKYHPDRGVGGDETKFKEVSEAYRTLSDTKKRAEYDAYGHVFSGGGGSPFEDFARGFGAQGFSHGAGGVEWDLGDIFGDIFGTQSSRRAQARRGRDISIDLSVSFKEAVFGREKTILLAKTVACDTCSGSGREEDAGVLKCQKCNGQGQVRETRNSILGVITSVRDCSGCEGEGSIPKKKCLECSGLGVLKRQEEIKVSVPFGIRDGEVIRLSGMGEAIRKGTAGDLYIKVHVENHELFKREGDNLIMELSVKLSDAVLGSEYSITTLEGPALSVKIPSGITISEVLRIRGRGVPKDASAAHRGDLLIKLKVELPKKLSRKAKKIFEELRSEGV